MSELNKLQNRNVIIHSVCFLLLFTSFNTSCGISQRVLTTYQNETKDTDNPFRGINGYTSIGTLYFFFAVFNWFAPVVVEIFTPKFSMMLGGLTYALYVTSFIYPNTSFMYLASAIVGCGAAVIWTAQGVFLTENSNDDNMQRNSGIFWSILQCSMIIGNLYIYFKWKGITTVSSDVRIPLYTIFTALCGAGCFGFLQGEYCNIECFEF